MPPWAELPPKKGSPQAIDLVLLDTICWLQQFIWGSHLTVYPCPLSSQSALAWAAKWTGRGNPPKLSVEKPFDPPSPNEKPLVDHSPNDPRSF